jgi:DNA-binding transcriptional LysR family regulator
MSALRYAARGSLPEIDGIASRSRVFPSHPLLTALIAADWLTPITADLGLRSFAIPLGLPPVDVGIAWHPRNDIDPAHRWFRQHLASTFVRSRPELHGPQVPPADHALGQ